MAVMWVGGWDFLVVLLTLLSFSALAKETIGKSGWQLA
jgi:hypothetical protein